MDPKDLIEILFEPKSGTIRADKGGFPDKGAGLNDPSVPGVGQRFAPAAKPTHVSYDEAGEPKAHLGFRPAVLRVWGKRSGHVAELTPQGEKVIWRAPYNETNESIMESLLQESLSPELASALEAAGHGGPEGHISRATKEDPTSSVAILHNNTRVKEGEGQYRITFLDKARTWSGPGGDEWEEHPSPSAHLAYDTVDDAVRHLGTIKKLHSVGVPNDEVKDFLAMNNTSVMGSRFNYKPKTQGQFAQGINKLDINNAEHRLPVLADIENEEKVRAVKRFKGPVFSDQPEHEYESLVKDVTTNILTEETEYMKSARMAPIPQVPLADAAKPIPSKRTYRRLAQIACAMGAATAAGS